MTASGIYALPNAILPLSSRTGCVTYNERETSPEATQFMASRAPSVIVLAGPNGAGKSTVAESLLRGVLAVDEFVNADIIAQGLSGFNPEDVARRRAGLW